MRRQRVNIEYVSANPTGPMHMGHCRGAVVGDALASLLEYSGHQVTREYYVNDAGGQVDVLARSAHLRYREALGEAIGDIPEGYYPGDYLKPVGEKLAAEYGDRYVDAPESDGWRRPKAGGDEWTNQRRLSHHHDVSPRGRRTRARPGRPGVETLRARGLVYQGVLERPKARSARRMGAVELTCSRDPIMGRPGRTVRKSAAGALFGGDIDYHPEGAGGQQMIELGATMPAQSSASRPGGGAKEGRVPFDARSSDGEAATRRRAGQDVKRSGNCHPRRGVGEVARTWCVHHDDPKAEPQMPST